MEFKRESLLKALSKSAWNGTIKVITGARRVGKSYLLFELYKNYLLGKGVNPKNIIMIPLDTIENEKLRDRHSAWDFIKNTVTDESERYYVFIDEVQMMEKFEDLMNSLLREKNIDTYVTGSNSKFLSSDLATEFRGRDTQIPVRPLTFNEIIHSAERKSDLFYCWEMYLRYGGLPQVWKEPYVSQKKSILSNIFRNTYIKDIAGRYKLENPSKAYTLAKVISSGIGSMTSPKKISNTFLSAGDQLSNESIEELLNHMEDAFIIERADKFDIRGRKYIGGLRKYYFEDLGIRNAVINFREERLLPKLIENAVYNELRSRGMEVDIGMINDPCNKAKEYEVDFIATQNDAKFYIQVALDTSSEEKMRQEKKSLLSIPDSFKKIMVSGLDTISCYDNQGILHVNLIDFMTDSEILRNDFQHENDSFEL